ncbi:MAG: VWA domain-containing protein [Candidatus Schekmanbacteria bacterium]|nr:VWA domain-containing protein [Candidatus Schekmanbacteria bacterium]
MPAPVRLPRWFTTYFALPLALCVAAAAVLWITGGWRSIPAFAVFVSGANPKAVSPPIGPLTVAPAPPAMPAPATAALPSQEAPKVDVVFVLDTTGSMSGLIEGAKRKVWSIASQIADGQPTPDLRVALIGYRDTTDEYVTKRFDFSPDLDAVFQNLSSLSANGGGDTPEHVSRALSEAVYDLAWTQTGQALKLIFLVGDAPAHTDYQDGYDYRKASADATLKGITINTIRCGNADDTGRVFTEIASLAHGKFASIDSTGGMQFVATPYDAKLAELNARLADSTIVYGAETERSAARARIESGGALAAPMAASRASYLAKSKKLTEKDLIADVESGDVALEAIPASDLPTEMQGLPPEQLKGKLAEAKMRQDAIKREIAEVSKTRDGYIKEQQKEAPAGPGFDEEVLDMIRTQAADKGIKY